MDSDNEDESNVFGTNAPLILGSNLQPRPEMLRLHSGGDVNGEVRSVGSFSKDRPKLNSFGQQPEQDDRIFDQEVEKDATLVIGEESF